MDDMPSVTEFWEMLLYGLEGYSHDNLLDRYSLISLMLECGKLHTEGGKLVIYKEHDKPTDPTQRQNWLPAPEGPFYLTMRIYWPEQAALDGSWTPPSVRKV
jgi:hypothetical protein